MPIYEYRCNSCQKVEGFLLKSVNETLVPVCPACGSKEMIRLMSSFAHHKSTSDIHDAYGDPSTAGPDYYEDPRNIGRWAEQKFDEMGLEMPSHIDDMIQAAREGEMPDEVKDIQPGLSEV